MIAALALTHRLRKQDAQKSPNNPDPLDRATRVDPTKRRRRRKDCAHDPVIRGTAEILVGFFSSAFEPFKLRSALGNGLESTAWANIFKTDKSILIAMVVYRLLSIAVVQTYYVPDEYWQSLEVAHFTTFRVGFLTWEWQAKIRSYLYPAVFAVLYKVLDILSLDSFFFLTKFPRILQSVFYAVGDLYLYKLSAKLANPLVGQWTLICNCLSWFIFYCSSRTLSNTTETTLVIIALYFYPWYPSQNRLNEAWKFILSAAVSVVIRPTSLILWLPLVCCHLWSSRMRLWNLIALYTSIGLFSVCVMMRIDKAFYGEWTLSPLNFFYMNIARKLSHIYGTHPWHWYLVQGLPFTLSTHLLLLVIGWRRCKNRAIQMLFLYTIVVYSFLAHKEFRFIMPILPIAMHICGYYVTSLHQETKAKENTAEELKRFTDEELSSQIAELSRNKGNTATSADIDSGVATTDASDSLSEAEVIASVKQKLHRIKHNEGWFAFTPKRAVILLAVGNIPMMLYFSLMHQRGPLDAMAYLHAEGQTKPNMSVLFLMPCHSTPYYSHMHRNITMRFLTCTPNLEEKSNYTDEADTFYSQPYKWLKSEFIKNHKKHIYSHIVIYDSLEKTLAKYFAKGVYNLRASFFNSHFSDSDRRSQYIKVYIRN